MATNTSLELRNKVIYSIYVRNHGENGNFEDVIQDLKRIKNLGVDIIWLMPIHPIGKVKKKGPLGCPYAIRDYRQINPSYGTINSFQQLVNAIHQFNMLCMIDVVFHHTSPDSLLFKNNPEFFYRKPDGTVGNKVGEWTDILDLDFNQRELWKELIDVLQFWADLGVDGFRCDVASLIPMEFWMKARKKLSRTHPQLIWLAETISPDFITYIRREGFYAASDSEIYHGFDITYDYDGYTYFRKYLDGNRSLEEYLEKLRQQETIYPDNYVKLRFLENHDQPRIRKLITDPEKIKTWTAFLYFQKGSVLLYGGQETEDPHTPSLFHRDPVDWKKLSIEFSHFLKLLYILKQREIFSKGYYRVHSLDKKGVIFATYTRGESTLAGLFNVEGKTGKICLPIEDGRYVNLLSENFTLEVINGSMEIPIFPVVFETTLRKE